MLAICKSKQEAKCRLRKHLDQTVLALGPQHHLPHSPTLVLLQNYCHTALTLTVDMFILTARWQMP